MAHFVQETASVLFFVYLPDTQKKIALERALSIIPIKGSSVTIKLIEVLHLLTFICDEFSCFAFWLQLPDCINKSHSLYNFKY